MELKWEALEGAESSTAFAWPGGPGTLVAQGTWGGATLSLEISADGGSTWVPLPIGVSEAGEPVPLALSDDAAVNFNVARCSMRATTSGGTGTDLDVYVGRTYENVKTGTKA